jgi:hypothetical protein
MNALQALRARVVEWSKRKRDLVRWSEGAEGSTPYAAGMRRGLRLAADFFCTGRFGTHGMCVHTAFASSCPACAADRATESALCTEGALLEHDIARAAVRFRELERWREVYAASRSEDPEAREFSTGLAAGLEAARVYLERGLFVADVPRERSR